MSRVLSTAQMVPRCPWPGLVNGVLLTAMLVAGGLWPATPGWAGARGAANVAASDGPPWSELSAQQRAVLGPLEPDWSALPAERRRKWLEVAGRYPTMSDAERTRLKSRMAEWSRLSPKERAQTRLNFREAQQIDPHDRQAKWEAYQALTPEQRQKLAAHPQPAGETGRHSATAEARREGAPQRKSNIVPYPTTSTAVKPVTPAVVQAKPGATTNLISKVGAPPSHQQTGLPKIAATPVFVDSATLLPQRGSQGAATVKAKPSSSPTPGGSKASPATPVPPK